MSYGKKDDDGDAALVNLDRTQVFQEGANPLSLGLAACPRLPRDSSVSSTSS
jgi:hypothetical protein